MPDVSSAPDAAAASPETTTTTGGGGGGSPHVEKVRKMLFRRMLVGVNDGRYFLGLFHCVDKQGNILLQDAVEYRSSARRRRGDASSSPTEQRGLGLILIPAACRSSCHVDCAVEESMALLSLDK
uniref:Sm domain-containing protein n=1 Tax=Oryza punctata TaxID=4537 RepID=A0A0E0LEN7_ORYPU